MKDIQAVLFSGGKGKRLFPITDYYQKVMMPLGDKGIPVLEYIIRHLAFYGIQKFVVLIGYRANQIRRYFGNGERFGIEIQYIRDKDNIKGTGAALLNAKESITEKNMLIYYTDILSDINIQRLIDFHKTHKKVGSLWVDPTWKIPDGVIEKTDDNKVISIDYNPKNISTNTGISILSTRVFDYLNEFIENKDGKLEIDLSVDIFPRLVDESQLAAFSSNEWWIDLGNLYRYKSIDDNLLATKFNHFLKTGE